MINICNIFQIWTAMTWTIMHSPRTWHDHILAVGTAKPGVEDD